MRAAKKNTIAVGDTITLNANGIKSFSKLGPTLRVDSITTYRPGVDCNKDVDVAPWFTATSLTTGEVVQGMTHRWFE